MRVKLGRRGDYAILALIDVAQHPEGGPRKAHQIATSMDMRPGFLRRVLADLVAAGLLDSGAGPRGGYRLARSADTVTLLAIVDAAEGPSPIVECPMRGVPCDWAPACPIHLELVDACGAFRDSLATTSLAELARTYTPPAAGHIDHAANN